jgi:Flp pilus assembly protein TadD
VGAPAEALVRAESKRRSADHEDLKTAFDQARRLAREGQEGAALSLLQTLRRRHPKNADLHWLLGGVQRQANQLRDAELAFTRAVELDPKHVSARADLAMVLERRGAYAEALSAINRAASLSPNDPGIRADRAVIRFHLGQVDAAVGDMDRASRRLPDDPDVALNHALILLSRGKKDDFDKALKILRRARRHAPDNPLVRLAYAQANLAAKRDQAALAAYDRILDTNGSQAWANWGRGLVAYRSRDYKAARKYGTVARDAAAGTFTFKAYGRKRFYSSDAKAYLQWLDARLSKVPVAGTSSGPKIAPSLARLTIAGGCKRAETKARLNSERARIASCFGQKEGAVGARVVLEAGEVSTVEKTSDGVSKGVDLCVLKVLEKASYPKDATCTIRLTWKRASAGPRAGAARALSVPDLPAARPKP